RSRRLFLAASPISYVWVLPQVLEPLRSFAAKRANDEVAVHEHGEARRVVGLAAAAAGRLKDDKASGSEEIGREAPGPHHRLDHAVQCPKEFGREIRSSRSLASCRRGRSCCRYHSLLPGAREIALLLLLLDEGVRTVVLTHDRFADVSDLAALVEFAAQKGELVLRRR